MAEDLGQEDVVGLVFWFELVAADGSVGAAEVARFPGLVQGEAGAWSLTGFELALKDEGGKFRSSSVSKPDFAILEPKTSPATRRFSGLKSLSCQHPGEIERL